MIVKDTQEVARAAIVEEPFRPVAGRRQPDPGGDRRQPDAAAARLRLDDAEADQPGAAGLEARSTRSSRSGSMDLGTWSAWTSDVKNRWAQDWLNWPEFGRFWSQAVKRTIPVPVDRNLQVQVTPEGVDGPDHGRHRLGRQDVSATSCRPAPRSSIRRTSSSQVSLPQVAPGRYETRIPIGDRGRVLPEHHAGRRETARSSGRATGRFRDPVLAGVPRPAVAIPTCSGQLAGLTGRPGRRRPEGDLRARAPGGRPAARPVALADGAGGAAVRLRRRGPAATARLDGRASVPGRTCWTTGSGVRGWWRRRRRRGCWRRRGGSRSRAAAWRRAGAARRPQRASRGQPRRRRHPRERPARRRWGRGCWTPSAGPALPPHRPLPPARPSVLRLTYTLRMSFK